MASQGTLTAVVEVKRALSDFHDIYYRSSMLTLLSILKLQTFDELIRSAKGSRLEVV